MYKINCKDLKPDGDCDFVVAAETKDEVIKKLYKHADQSHTDMMKDMSEDDKKKLDMKIHEMLDAQMQ